MSLNNLLNKFFHKITLKKQYTQKLKNKIHFFISCKKWNYKNLNLNLFAKKYIFLPSILITYIVYISFTRRNTWLHVTNFSGMSKFFYSAGTVFFNKNRKRIRIPIIRSIMYFLLQKLKFLFHKPMVLHLKNVKSIRFWILKKFKTKLPVLALKNFNSYVYNGCRKKKIRRRKFKH